MFVAEPLFERQKAIIEFLADPAAFLCPRSEDNANRLLADLNADRLRLVGTLCLAKRLRKITAILPKTMWCLREREPNFFQDFASKYPPVSAQRYYNARQFYEYLCHAWRRKGARPPFIKDLARCELAVAYVRGRSPESKLAPTGFSQHGLYACAIRRSPDIKLLQCRYDVRTLLDPLGAAVSVKKRLVCLLFLPAGSRSGVRVFEITPQLYRFLASLKHWCCINDFNVDRETETAIGEFVENGIVEVRP